MTCEGAMGMIGLKWRLAKREMAARRAWLPENPLPYVKSRLQRRMCYIRKGQRLSFSRNVPRDGRYSEDKRATTTASWMGPGVDRDPGLG